MKSRWRGPFVLLASLAFTVAMAGPSDRSEPPRTAEEVLGLSGSPVMRVESVIPSSAAEAAGISPFDLVAGFNGLDIRKFRTAEKFFAEMRAVAFKDSVEIKILKFDPATGTHSPSSVTVSLGGDTNRQIGLRATFAYIVLGVPDEGFAARIGATPGDFIEDVEGRQVSSFQGPQELDTLFDEIDSQPGREFTLSLAHWTPNQEGDRTATVRKWKGFLR